MPEVGERSSFFGGNEREKSPAAGKIFSAVKKKSGLDALLLCAAAIQVNDLAEDIEQALT